MGAQQILVSSKTLAGSVAGFLTSQELALLLTPGMLAWYDARGWSAEVSGNTITIWYSRAAVGALHPALSTPSSSQGLHGGIVPGGTARYEIRDGIDQNNNPIAGNNNKKATGNAVFIVPNTSFTVLFYARIPTPASSTILMGTVDTTAPVSFEPLSTMGIRWYSARSSTFIATAAAAIPDQNYHLIAFKYDAVNKLGQIEIDNVIARAYVSFDLSAHVGQVLQMGTVQQGVTVLAGSGFGVQGLLLIGAINDVASALYAAVLASRPT